MGILKNADLKSTMLKQVDPWTLAVKSLMSGRGKASQTVFSFNALKSEHGRTPPPALLAR